MKKRISLVVLLSCAGMAIAQVRIVQVDLAANEITLTNCSDSAVDVGGYWLAALQSPLALSGLTVVQGSSLLEPGMNIVYTDFPSLPNPSDLCVYNTDEDFMSINAMDDFMQWGAGGIGYESVAVAKGIWPAGGFIDVMAPYQWLNDDCSLYGPEHWVTGNSVGLTEHQAFKNVRIYPVPARGTLNIDGISGGEEMLWGCKLPLFSGRSLLEAPGALG